MDAVTLKNGSRESAALVTTVVMSATRLLNSKPIVFYELVMLARDRNHVPWAGTVGEMLGLAGDDGRMHESVRNIIVSGAVGDGLDMAWTDPRA